MPKGLIKLPKRFVWILLLIVTIIVAKPVLSQISSDEIQKIFLVGRSLGTAYYNLVDLHNKSKELPYSSIKQ